MGLFNFRRKESRASVIVPGGDPISWFSSLFNTGSTSTGETVTQETALRFSAVWACIQVRAESLAQLPIGIFEKTDTGRISRSDHPIYYLLHNEPNKYMASFTFFKTMQSLLDLYGNAYAEITRKDKVTVIGFSIIHPAWVTAKIVNDELFYVVNDGLNPTRTIPQYNMIHLVGFSTEGIVGQSPISAHRESVGMAMATQKFGAKFYANGASLGGTIEHPGKLSKEAQERLKASWAKSYEGQGNAFRTAILEEGMKYTQIGINPIDAQYVETMRFSVEEIARIYRVPLHMIGDLSRSTNNNIEEQGISFVRDTMAPVARIWEQELTRKVFREDEKRRLYVEFNMNGLLRGNATARAAFYQTMVQNSLLSPNEIRSLENMNAYEGGDKYIKPLNMGYVEDDETQKHIEDGQGN